MNSRVALYFAGSVAYGCARKINDLKDAKIEIYDRENHDYKVVPMLITDKAAIMATSCIAAPALLPIYVMKDLAQVEMWWRQCDPSDYGYRAKTSIHHYLF